MNMQGECRVFSNGRKTIGVFLSQVNSEFQESLSRGISIRAQERNYNIAFLLILAVMDSMNMMPARVR
jgi:hypothetical protein